MRVLLVNHSGGYHGRWLSGAEELAAYGRCWSITLAAVMAAGKQDHREVPALLGLSPWSWSRAKGRAAMNAVQATRPALGHVELAVALSLSP